MDSRYQLYIYIYAFSRRIYPKRLTVHSAYTFFVSMCVPWELNPLPFALLTQCSTTEPQEHKNVQEDTQATVDPMVQPVLGVFIWLPWVLLPHESWCWGVPRHSMAWLFLFPYKHLRRSTSEISKGSVLSYYRNLGSLEYETSTAFPDALWAALLSRFFQRNLRCGGEAAVYIARCPSHFGGLCRAS